MINVYANKSIPLITISSYSLEKAKYYGRLTLVHPRNINFEIKDKSSQFINDESISNELIPLCVEVSDLAFLGHCFPLFFYFLKVCIAMMCVIFIFIGIISIYLDWDGMQNDFIVRISIFGVNDYTNNDLYYLCIINFIGSLLMLMILGYTRTEFLRISKICTKKNPSIANNSLRITWIKHDNSSLPVEIKDRDDIQQNIDKKIFAGEIGDIINMVKQKDELKNKDDLSDKDRAKKIEEDLPKKINEYEKKPNIRGIIILVFKSRTLAKEFLKKSKNKWSKLFGSDIDYAPEPIDTIWENAGVKNLVRIRLILKTWSWAILLILISFIIIFTLNVLKTEISLPYVSVLVNLAIIIVNFLLGKWIRYYSTHEKHLTSTDYYTSVALKLTVAQIFNTMFIVFLVDYISQRQDNMMMLKSWVKDMFWVLFTNAFVSPFTFALSNDVLIRYYWRFKLHFNEKYGRPYFKSHRYELDQSKVNEFYSGFEMDVSYQYASILMTMYITSMYAPFDPIAWPISIIGLAIRYWVQKILLLRKYARPKKIGKKLPKLMFKSLRLMIFFFSFSNLLITTLMLLNEQDLSYLPTSLILAIFGCIISGINIIFPYSEKIWKILRHLCYKRESTRKNDILIENTLDNNHEFDYNMLIPLYFSHEKDIITNSSRWVLCKEFMDEKIYADGLKAGIKNKDESNTKNMKGKQEEREIIRVGSNIQDISSNNLVIKPLVEKNIDYIYSPDELYHSAMLEIKKKYAQK